MPDHFTVVESEQQNTGEASAIASRELEMLRDMLVNAEAEIGASEQRIKELEAEIRRFQDEAISLRVALGEAPKPAVRAKTEADLADIRRQAAELRRSLLDID